MVKCMKKWEHILKYQPPFLVYTDAASLVYHESEIRRNYFSTLVDEPTTEENEEYQEANEVGEMKITFASELEGNPWK